MLYLTQTKQLLVWILLSCFSFNVYAEHSPANREHHAVLRLPYSPQHIAPIVIRDDYQQPIAGILFDTAKAIAKQAGYQTQFVPVSRKAISNQLLEKQLDMHCVANPAWYKDKNLKWSEALYFNPDLVLNRPKWTTLEQLQQSTKQNQHLRIGTTLGYKYPELKPMFESNQLVRIDSISGEGSFARYIKGEIDGLVIAKHEARYLTNLQRFKYIQLNNNQIFCAFGPALTPLHIEQLNKAIKALKQHKQFEQILEKYAVN